MTILLRPHVDQLARDALDDLGLITSEIGSKPGVFADQVLDAVEVLAQ